MVVMLLQSPQLWSAAISLLFAYLGHQLGLHVGDLDLGMVFGPLLAIPVVRLTGARGTGPLVVPVVVARVRPGLFSFQVAGPSRGPHPHGHRLRLHRRHLGPSCSISASSRR